MIYKNFTIEQYKGIKQIEISLKKNDLVLLLGLNESGKTTILKAIESFDYTNDPRPEFLNEFYRSIRNKSNINSNESAKVTSHIEIDEPIKMDWFKSIIRATNISSSDQQNIEGFLREINTKKEVIISRVFPFKNGNPKTPYYEFVTDHPFTKNKVSKLIAKEIVKHSPYIIYFEDFKDRIPDKIHIIKGNDAFNSDWYDIIDGLFYNTNKEYSIANFNKFFSKSNPRRNDADTVLKRVNKKFNETFSEKWKDLSGVKDIDETELKFNHLGSKYFEISITDTDGTTFNVEERSKGALWYLSFLMKTEFRRKKLRLGLGRPIFLIDEPASNLHSTAQQNMIEDFQKLVEDTSVIYSTHSQYLISLENIKNTYVVKRDGIVTTTLWSDYIKQDKSNQTYYQPLANILNIIPNNFDIPWQKAILTEGPSDLKVLETMFSICFPKKKKDFVIYPGTSAQNLNSLISLNIGWNTNFYVLLDSDKEGKKAQKRYIDEYELNNNIIKVLPIDNKKIESCFTQKEKLDLYKLIFNKEREGNVNKKEFSTIFSILSSKKEVRNKARKILSEKSIELFISIFDSFWNENNK
ncbi:putative ATP-dependent endonuclease of OLD family [Lutibacter sp. Hel_I_33_5]|uniref:AAA family ATPase n=1 Tax=Lutibacter sp. Hel_I_33_5 TaxID=1566289 RepID=UPI0011A1D622|nr:AAA family ATPase [Lutibacter sp. Hel_I_33_5]TVZ57395.1 putative ATP-dependent endonuclease of OLD family [Lutibacter sp. Hel_I_33_5]